MSEALLQQPEPGQNNEFLPINGTDYVEFYVGNAKQSAFFYQHAFGFRAIAYRGPETGYRDSASYLLTQGKIRFVLTSALTPESAIADHVHLHGDGVRDIALWVDDATSAVEETMRRGAELVQEPKVLTDEHGRVITGTIRSYGDTVHTFVQRNEYNGVFMPGFEPYSNIHVNVRGLGLKQVDHIVGNVPLGEMTKLVAFYQDVMGFQQLRSIDDEDLYADYSALMSRVMTDASGRIRLPINEPAKGKNKKSEIDEYLEFYRGAGVQHLALATDDIVATVTDMRRRGVRFVTAAQPYYEAMPDRVNRIDEDPDDLADLSILVDRDAHGYLLQAFTFPIQDRPTLFYEIIQRKGARSFGQGNFKALFEARQRKQERRQNL